MSQDPQRTYFLVRYKIMEVKPPTALRELTAVPARIVVRRKSGEEAADYVSPAWIELAGGWVEIRVRTPDETDALKRADALMGEKGYRITPFANPGPIIKVRN